MTVSFAYAAQRSEAEENKAEERESEEEQMVDERGQEENIAKKRKIEGREEENIPEEREEDKTAQGGNYTVLGRLSVPGTKRKYTVTQDELKRRIKAENMSNNMLRSLIRVCIYSKPYSNLLYFYRTKQYL